MGGYGKPLCEALGSDAVGMFCLGTAAEGKPVLVDGAAGLEGIITGFANPGGPGVPGVPGITGWTGKVGAVGIHKVVGR